MNPDDELEHPVEPEDIDPVVNTKEHIQQGWSDLEMLDKCLWNAMTEPDSSETYEHDLQHDLEAEKQSKKYINDWVEYSFHPGIWTKIATKDRQEWMWLAVRYGLIDLVQALAKQDPSLLTQTYTAIEINKTGNLHELMYFFYKYLKEKKLDNSVAFKERVNNYEALSREFKSSGVACKEEFLKEQQKEAANPAQSVENTVFLSSVHKAMHRLFSDQGYFKNHGPIKKYVHTLKKQVAKRQLLNWVEQLNDKEYCKSKGFTPETAAGALDFFRAAFASAEKGAVAHSDPRVRLYAAYSAELEHRKFSMLDVFVVAWQALQDPKHMTPIVRDNLLNAWVYAMHEVGSAYDDPQKNPVLPGTRQGCAQAMVNPTIALFDGNYSGIQIRMLNEGQITYQALALVADYVEKNNKIYLIKKWIKESGMPEALYQQPQLALEETLQDMYKDFGPQAQDMLQLAMGTIEYHGVPDRLKVFLLKKTFNDFLVITLNKMTLLERVELSEYLQKNKVKRLQVNTKVGIRELWVKNPFLVKLAQLCPGFRQQWNAYLNQKVLELLPRYEKEKLLPVYRKAEVQAIKKILIDPEFSHVLKIEKLGFVTRLRTKVGNEKSVRQEALFQRMKQ